MIRHLRRTVALAAVVASTAMVLSACALQPPSSRSTDASGSSNKSSTIVVGGDDIADSLDPLQASDAHNDFNIAPMYDRLVDYSSKGAIVPKLATAWKFSDNATVLTLTLRKGVKFHSGDTFSAADVVFTLNRIKKLDSGVASFIPDYVSSKALGDLQVQITLAKTNLDFLSALSPIYILDSKLVAKHEGDDNAQSWLATHDAGSGPYEMSDYKPNQELDLTRFAGYWGYTDQRPGKVVLEMISNASTAYADFTAGNLDITMGLNGIELASIKKNPKDQVIYLPSLRETYAWLNNKGGVTSNVKVREAIQLAYNYKGHLSSALGGQGKIADAILPPGIPCTVDFGKPTQNIAEAKKLIKQAGATGDTVTVAYQPAVSEFSTAATLMQASLEQIGLKVVLKAVTFPEYSQMVSSQSTMPDIALAWDFAAFPAAGPMLDREYATSFSGQTNFTWYSNPKVDQLLSAGMAATSQQQACQDYEQVQKQVVADHALLYIADPAVTMVTDRRVATIPYAPTSQDFNVGDLRMAK